VPAPLRVMRCAMRRIRTGEHDISREGRKKLLACGLHGAVQGSISLGAGAIGAKENCCMHLACSSFPVPDCPSAYAGWGNFMPWQH